MARKRVGVLISGGGGTLQALIDAARAPDYPAEIVLVLANIAEAGGLARAQAAGIPTTVVEHRKFADRPAFEAEVTARLQAAKTELVCLAGFMRLLTPGFV